jgi:hypothetical protein
MPTLGAGATKVSCVLRTFKTLRQALRWLSP